MAHRLGPILQGVVNTNPASFRQHFTNICLDCSGSNQKVRNWSKILGLSTSLAIFGIGIKAFHRDNEGTWHNERRLSSYFVAGSGSHERSIWLKTFGHNSDGRDFCRSAEKIKKDVYTSAKTLLSFFNLITPVSCAEAGEDVACNCSPFTKSKPPLPTKCNCVDCESKNSDCQTIKDQQAKVGPAPAAAASPLVGKSRPGSCSGAGPCGNRKHCNEPAELDMSALSARIGALKQIDWAEESDLSHCRLVKQASQVTVDSVTRIITEIASAYEDYNVEFRKVLDIMMDTLEESRNACGAELEMLEVKQVIIRSKIDEWKKKIQELDMFLCSLEKLANSAAESAFMAHAEYASIAMSERIQSLEREIKCIRDESREKEKDMLQLQSLIIVESGKGLK